MESISNYRINKYEKIIMNNNIFVRYVTIYFVYREVCTEVIAGKQPFVTHKEMCAFIISTSNHE